MIRLAFIGLALGCGGAATAGTQTLHGDCSTQACGPGMQCMEYYGLGGTSGPKLKSCEIPCVDDKSCPSGTTCGFIADGPGNVCG